jgi:hypothetical protein
MTSFTKIGASRAELKLLNNWRLYYQVNLLSEICFATGAAIQPYYLEYNPTTTRQTTTKLIWPIQAKPDELSFKVWKRYINSCFLYPNNKCKQTGTWIMDAIEETSPRLSYISTQSHHIYITQSNGKYHKHTATSIRQHSANYDATTYQIVDMIPKDCIPAYMYSTTTVNQVQFSIPITKYTSSPIDKNSSWQQLIL